jgi:hypothetical protein
VIAQPSQRRTDSPMKVVERFVIRPASRIAVHFEQLRRQRPG